MTLYRTRGFGIESGLAAVFAVALAFGSAPFSLSQADEMATEMTPAPATVVEVLEQLNARALDEEGEPTGAPTYHTMMALLHASGLVDELGLGADFACAVPEDAMAEETDMAAEEAAMVERSPMTVFVPDDAALEGLSDDVKARLASEQAAALAMVQAHTIADEVTFAAVRNSQRWFTTGGGAKLRISGLQGSMIINPGSAADMRPMGEHALCAGDGPVFVLHFMDEAMAFDLPPEEAEEEAAAG